MTHREALASRPEDVGFQPHERPECPGTLEIARDRHCNDPAWSVRRCQECGQLVAVRSAPAGRMARPAYTLTAESAARLGLEAT